MIVNNNVARNTNSQAHRLGMCRTPLSILMAGAKKAKGKSL